ncbi:glycosyltransferase [Photobacterium damselae subsp. damselae]|uniref:glycosyltransferase n=1 Tax=Photobacterium damselae TaxID=38293 RepID=UPI00311ACEF1
MYKNTLKGGELILNLLKLIDYSNKFDGTNIKVVVFGIHDPDIFKKEVSFKFTNIEFDIYGYINSKRDLSLIYKKIDFFVHFSKIENLSTVILESITAGCIPICFNVGGNKDILINEYNEFLINPFDVKSAFKKILTTQDNSVVKYNLSNFKGDFNDRATCLEHKKTYEEYLND